MSKLFLLMAAGLGLCAAAQTPSIEVKDEGFHNESELNVVDAQGNSSAQSIGVTQQNGVRWESDVVKAQYHLLRAQNAGTESARNWNVALRYERKFTPEWGAFAQQGLESDTFAGIDRRYNSDVGGRYEIIHTDAWTWVAEAGYRFTKEDRFNSPTLTSQFGRAYTEGSYSLSKSSSVKLWHEYLPNFSHPRAYLMNAELSLVGILTSVLSLKVSYLVKYNNEPPPGVVHYTDRLLTTSLVARF